MILLSLKPLDFQVKLGVVHILLQLGSANVSTLGNSKNLLGANVCMLSIYYISA